MKLLGLIYMAAGCTLAILALRVAHGNWTDFAPIALYSAIPNALTGGMAYLLFRRRERQVVEGQATVDLTGDRVFLIACYFIGIGAGTYFYYT